MRKQRKPEIQVRGERALTGKEITRGYRGALFRWKGGGGVSGEF